MIQRFSRYNLRAGIGHKTLTFSFKILVDNIGNNSIQDSISQKFQPLIIQQTSLFCLNRIGFMKQSLFIKANIMRIETQHPIKTKIRLLILSEKKSYSINKVAKILIQHISSRLHKHCVHQNRMYYSKQHGFHVSEPC